MPRTSRDKLKNEIFWILQVLPHKTAHSEVLPLPKMVPAQYILTTDPDQQREQPLYQDSQQFGAQTPGQSSWWSDLGSSGHSTDQPEIRQHDVGKLPRTSTGPTAKLQ